MLIFSKLRGKRSKKMSDPEFYMLVSVFWKLHVRSLTNDRIIAQLQLCAGTRLEEFNEHVFNLMKY